MNNYSDSHGLRADCLCAFSKYVSEAHETCKLLLAIEKFPSSERERQAIVEQRQLENSAFEDYLSARAKLLEAASWDGSLNVPKIEQFKLN